MSLKCPVWGPSRMLIGFLPKLVKELAKCVGIELGTLRGKWKIQIKMINQTLRSIWEYECCGGAWLNHTHRYRQTNKQTDTHTIPGSIKITSHKPVFMQLPVDNLLALCNPPPWKNQIKCCWMLRVKLCWLKNIFCAPQHRQISPGHPTSPPGAVHIAVPLRTFKSW